MHSASHFDGQNGRANHEDAKLDPRLRAIGPRACYGAQALEGSLNGLQLFGDDEYVFTSGSTIRVYNDGSGTANLIQPQPPGSVCVRHYSLSADCKMLAIIVEVQDRPEDKKYTMDVFMYDSMQTQLQHPHKPKCLSYTVEELRRSTLWPDLYFSCCNFSADNVMLAAAANVGMLGVVVFDTVLLNIVTMVGTTSLLRGVSFNPDDSSKLCTIGDNNTLSMWRISGNKSYLSPVHGLTQNKTNSNLCAVWFDDARVLVGTSLGYILLLQGCEQIQPPTWAFGVPPGQDRPEQANYLESPVNHLLLRGDFVFAVSDSNCLTIFEIKRFGASGANAPTCIIMPLKHYRISNISCITGMCWQSRSITSSYAVTIASATGILVWDSRADNLGSKAGLASGNEADAIKRSVTMKNGKIFAPLADTIEWEDVVCDRLLTDFHSGMVHSLSVAKRTSMFVTASQIDGSVRVRDFSSGTGPSFVATDFSDRSDEIPNSVHFHPSGNYVALAGEDEAIEFIVSDTNLEAVTRIPTKVPFTLPSGAPFVNQQPVSLVRYSNTGHLLAVVTGRLAQVFNMTDMHVSSDDFTATPKAIMTLMDHTAPITDIVFASDDSRLLTASSDGCVYEWPLGSSTRARDFAIKGTPCTKIAISNDNTIIAVFNANTGRSGSRGTPGMTPGSRVTRRLSTGVSIPPTPSSPMLSRRSIAVTSTSGMSSPGTGARKMSVNTPTSRGPGGGLDEESFAEDAPDGNSYANFICVWKEEISEKHQKIYFENAVLSVAVGKLDHHTDCSIAVFGLEDGRVLISTFPIPLRSVDMQQAIPTTVRGGFDLNTHSSTSVSTKFASQTQQMHSTPSTASLTLQKIADNARSFVDESLCRSIQLHKRGVTVVACSHTGLWIFTGGADGTTHMLGTSLRARDLPEVPEKSRSAQNDFVITDRDGLLGMRSRLNEVDTIIKDKQRESDRTLQKLTDQHMVKMRDLEARMAREIKTRDEIIIKTREELIATNKRLNSEILTIKNSREREISQIESEYEKKLSKESLYLDKMRQAYDEFVLHARMDMQDYEKEMKQKNTRTSLEHNEMIQEQEKQKKALLAYIEYIKARNAEILEALNDAQESERNDMKGALHTQKDATEEAARAGRSEIANLTIESQKLKMEVAKKDTDVMKLTSDIGWANERIRKLEAALGEAASNLQKKTEVSEKWEFKAGERQQQILDLERIRKALTTQLHSLRQEMMPEKEKLSQVSERLQEVDREYELSLAAISDKDRNLTQRSSQLHLLQKQLRELRYSTSTKERSLMRAAKLLGEYKLALQEAQFKAVKKTIPAKKDAEAGDKAESSADTLTRKKKPKNEVVEVLTRSPNMDLSLTRLSDLLEPYILGDPGFVPEEEATLAMEERERHVMQLHKRVTGLKHNLESTEEVALNKVKMAYSDNQVLLEEVNSMRHRIKKLNQENQRQRALIGMYEIKQGSMADGGESSASAFGGQGPGYLWESQGNSVVSGKEEERIARSYEAGNIPGVHMYSRDSNDLNYAAGSQADMVEPSLSNYPKQGQNQPENQPNSNPYGVYMPSDAAQAKFNKIPTGHHVYRQNKGGGATGKNVPPKGLRVPQPQYREDTPMTADAREAVMRNADAKIAQIMKENEVKIAQMKGTSSAQDILESYQRAVPPIRDTAPPASNGQEPLQSMNKREQIASMGGIGKAPGPHNKESKAVTPKEVQYLPEI